jgi:hypothetical protein
MSAKLLVSAGTLDQASGGETFSPLQFGLALLLPPFFAAIGVPSLKVDEVSVNGSAAKACPANSSAPAAIARVSLCITFLPVVSCSSYDEHY